MGAHGHLHAIRKHLYPYPPPDTINDDYVIPLSVLAKGYRAIYEPSAVVHEEASEMTGFGRRIRIMAGNIQQMRYAGSLLHPLQTLPLFFFVAQSRPAARTVRIARGPDSQRIPPDRSSLCGPLLLPGTLYLLAILGFAWTLRPRTLMLPFYFAMINAAAFFGFYHTLTKRRSMAWK